MNKNATIKLAAALALAGAAVFLLVRHFSQTDDADKISQFICLHESTPTGFTMSIREVEAMTRGGGQIYCPIHNSDETNIATTCPECEAPIVMGPHGITPEFCWKCDAKQPNGGGDLFHAGVH